MLLEFFMEKLKLQVVDKNYFEKLHVDNDNNFSTFGQSGFHSKENTKALTNK